MSNNVQSLSLVNAVVYSGCHSRPATDRANGIRVPRLEQALPTAENLSELREVLAVLLNVKK